MPGKLVKEVDVKLAASGYEDAKLKIDRLTAAADKLSSEHPEIKPTIDSAKALLEARLLRMGIQRELSGITMSGGGGGGGIFGRLLGASGMGPNGGKGLFSGLDTAAIGPVSGLPAIAAALPVVGALAVELTGLASGFAAAAVGLGAFAAVARPTFTALSTNLTALSTATGNYQAASQALDIAIRKSPADMKAYQATIHGLEPDLQNAARLLTNQGVVWQSLSPSMQKSVIALHDNASAYRALLPDQKTALTALLAERTAWNNLSPAQQAASESLSKLGASYQKIVTSLQPTVMKVFNDGLKALTNLLPALGPLAQAGGTALDGLLKQFGKFTASSGFKDWVKQFTALSGPAITAIGHGIADVAVNIGKLLTVMSKQGVVNAINIAFRILSGTIAGVTYVVGHIIHSWDQLTHDASNVVHAWNNVSHAIDNVRHALDNAVHAFDNIGHALGNFNHAIDNARHAVFVFAGDVISTYNKITTTINRWASDVGHAVGVAVAWFKGLPGRIIGAVGNLGSLLFNAGKSVISGLISGIQSMMGSLGGILGSITSMIPMLKGPIEKDRMLLYGSGQAIMGGLMAGIGSQVPGLQAQLAGITGSIGGGLPYPGAGSAGSAGTQQTAVLERLDNIYWALMQGNSINAGIGGDLGHTLGNASRAAAYRALYSARG